MTIKELSKARIGSPQKHGKLLIFPVTLEGERRPDVRIADETLEVSELESASVPQLQVHNPGKTPMLIPAGRVLQGGRQTRTVNVSILVPAGATMVIPVSCIEAGRWSGGRSFRASDFNLSRRARMAKERGVKGSIDRANEMRMDSRFSKHSDQGAVWDAVASDLHMRSVSSGTSRFDEVYARERDTETDRIHTEVSNSRPAEGQTGIAVAVGGKVLGVETFATTEDLSANWRALVSAIVLDLDDEQLTAAEGEATVADIEAFLARVAAAEATVAEGNGIGTEFHVATDDFVAHGLADESGALLHAYAFAEV